MACPATIDKIYQRDGAWEYDISFTEPSDGERGRDVVPEDELRVDPAARGHADRQTCVVYSSGATKLIGLVGGPSARQVESDSEELSSKDGR